MAQIQINPQLDPTKLKDAWSPPVSPDSDRTPAGPRGPAGPQTGFFLRGAALAIDLAALWALAWGANRYLRDPLLQLGGWTAPIAVVILVLYFALADGPLGKGRTLGKAMFGIRTIGWDGQALAFRRALPRSVIKTAPLSGLMLLQASTAHLVIGGRDSLAIALVQPACLAFLVSSLLCLVFDPLYRAIHDFAARSWAVKTPGPTVSIHDLLGGVAVNGKKKLIRAALLASPFVILVGRGGIAHSRVWPPETRVEMREIYQELNRILGTDEFLIYLRPTRAPLAGGADPAPGDSRSAAAAPAADTPGALEMLLIMGRIGAISAAEREALSDLESRMPAVRDWILHRFLHSDFAERARPLNLQAAHAEIRVHEILDLGINFIGEPILRFRIDFPEEDWPRLGVGGAPAAESPSAVEVDKATTGTRIVVEE